MGHTPEARSPKGRLFLLSALCNIERSLEAMLDLMQQIMGEGSHMLGELSPVERRNLVTHSNTGSLDPSRSLWQIYRCWSTPGLGG